MSIKKTIQEPLLDVINNGFCVGCGVCTYNNSDQIQIKDINGQYQAVVSPTISSEAIKKASHVCPFSPESPDEDFWGEHNFLECSHHSAGLGYYHTMYAGYVKSPDIYKQSSSGGIIRWLSSKLLEEGLVESVIHVSNFDSAPFFRYIVSSKPSDVISSATSSYYPVEMSLVIDHIISSNHKVAIVALPCFAKSIRNLLKANNISQSKVIIIGLICGHLKSTYYATMLATELGIKPATITSINFRKKLVGAKANEKGVEISGLSSSTNDPVCRAEKVQKMFGTDYGFGLFKYKSCDFCDDVFAETADIVVGDAWLPEFMGKGTSLIVNRSSQVDKVLQTGYNNHEISLQPLSLNKVLQSQDAGLRHRQFTIGYRLYLERKKNRWIPTKRISPSNNFRLRDKYIQILRIKAREISAYEFSRYLNGTLSYPNFKAKMYRYYGLYLSLYGNVIMRPLKAIFGLLGIDPTLATRLFTSYHAPQYRDQRNK